MRRISVCFLTLAVVSLLASTAVAQATLNTLLTFGQGSAYSGNSEANLIFDSAGNLYGTTGDSQPSSVFQLVPNGDGSWTENVLWEGSGSGAPWSVRPGVVFDTAGNLYASSFQGGTYGCGTVFRITPNGDGSWSEQNLVNFACGKDGSNPVSGVTFDTAGNIYGTATQGGKTSCSSGCGVVYKLTPNGTSWTFSLIYGFTGGPDGAYPDHPYLIFDSAGALYGVAAGGGKGSCASFKPGCGTVYKLTPNSNGSWTFHLLHSFTGGDDGGIPESTLLFDPSGNLYGTTTSGGKYGYGVAFELIPQSNGSWSEKVLHAFRSYPDGANPWGGLIFDSAGNLYGSTSDGGKDLCSYGGLGCGTIYELSPSASGEWTETVLVHLPDSSTNWPSNDLVMDSEGNLYGTAAGYNTASLGAIYEVVR